MPTVTPPTFDRAAHCRKIASQGGRALVAKHGRSHMSAIGKRGYMVTTCRYFLGKEKLHKKWLITAGLAAYWAATGLPMKRTRSGAAVWPEEIPTHPAHTAAPGQISLFERRLIERWEELPF